MTTDPISDPVHALYGEVASYRYHEVTGEWPKIAWLRRLPKPKWNSYSRSWRYYIDNWGWADEPTLRELARRYLFPEKKNPHSEPEVDPEWGEVCP